MVGTGLGMGLVENVKKMLKGEIFLQNEGAVWWKGCCGSKVHTDSGGASPPPTPAAG